MGTWPGGTGAFHPMTGPPAEGAGDSEHEHPSEAQQIIHEIRELVLAFKQLTASVNSYGSAVQQAAAAMVKMTDEVHSRLTELLAVANENGAALAQSHGSILEIRAMLQRRRNEIDDQVGAKGRRALLKRVPKRLKAKSRR